MQLSSAIRKTCLSFITLTFTHPLHSQTPEPTDSEAIERTTLSELNEATRAPTLGLNARSLADYKTCRKFVVINREGKTRKQLNTEIKLCRKAFPVASVLHICKKKAFLKAKMDDRLTAIKSYLSKCTELLNASKFEKKQIVPIRSWQTHRYFARMPLHIEEYVPTVDHPRYKCTNTQTAKESQANPENYLLWGMDITGLRAMNKLGYTKSIALIKQRRTKNEKEGFAVADLGHLYTDKDKKWTLYFPTVHCDYSGPTGEHFISHKVYFLDNRTPSIKKSKKQLKDPYLVYFGISIFKQHDKLPSLSAVLEALRANLKKPELKPYTLKNGNIWLASKPAIDFDASGLPKNLCYEKDPEDFVGMIKVEKGNPGKPQALVVANLRNLCRYANERAKVFLENF